jgi:hypothetical protein
MAPKLAERPIVLIEQGETAKAALDTVNETINSITKTAAILLLYTGFLGRNGWTIVTY